MQPRAMASFDFRFPRVPVRCAAHSRRALRLARSALTEFTSWLPDRFSRRLDTRLPGLYTRLRPRHATVRAGGARSLSPRRRAPEDRNFLPQLTSRLPRIDQASDYATGADDVSAIIY